MLIVDDREAAFEAKGGKVRFWCLGFGRGGNEGSSLADGESVGSAAEVFKIAEKS